MIYTKEIYNSEFERKISFMKKVILGSAMTLAGLLSTAVLLSGTMANDWTINGQLSSFRNMSQYGLMPVFYTFIGIVIIGFAIAIWGIFEKKN